MGNKLQDIDPNRIMQQIQGLSEGVQMVDLYCVMTENSRRRQPWAAQVHAWRSVCFLRSK